MTTDERVRYKNMQYDINRETTKISALSFGKIDKYEYLSSEEILSPDQKKIIEQVKFTYFSIGRAFEKTNLKKIEDEEKKEIKTIEDQGKK